MTEEQKLRAQIEEVKRRVTRLEEETRQRAANEEADVYGIDCGTIRSPEWPPRGRR